jgi:hypothetical protein
MYRQVKLGAENTSMEQCKWNRKERSGNHAEAKHGVRRYETATDIAAWDSEAWSSKEQRSWKQPSIASAILHGTAVRQCMEK